MIFPKDENSTAYKQKVGRIRVPCATSIALFVKNKMGVVVGDCAIYQYHTVSYHEGICGYFCVKTVV